MSYSFGLMYKYDELHHPEAGCERAASSCFEYEDEHDDEDEEKDGVFRIVNHDRPRTCPRTRPR